MENSYGKVSGGAVLDGTALLIFGPQVLVQGVPSLLPTGYPTLYNTVLCLLYLRSPNCSALSGLDPHKVHRNDVEECRSMICRAHLQQLLTTQVPMRLV